MTVQPVPYPKVVKKDIPGPKSYQSPIEVVIDELHVVDLAVVYAQGYVPDVRTEGRKILIRLYTAPGQEVSAGTDLSSITIHIEAIGR